MPANIRKNIKIIIAFFIILINFSLIIWNTRPPQFNLQLLPWFPTVKYMLFGLGVLILILVTQMMQIKRTWDYIYLNIGLWAFVILLAYPKIHYWLMTQTVQTVNDQFSLFFWLSAGIIFAITFLLGAFLLSRPIKPKHYPQAIILGHILAFSIISTIALVLLFIIESYFPVDSAGGQHPDLTTLFLIISFVQLVLFSIAGVKYFWQFWKNDKIYFWLTLVAIFFILAGFSFILEQFYHLAFSGLAYIYQLTGLICLLMVIFNEHSRFLESETELRRTLEESLTNLESKFQKHLNLLNGIQAGIFMLDAEAKFVFCNLQFCNMLNMDLEKLVGKNFESILASQQIDKFQLELQKLKETMPSQIEIELKKTEKQQLPILMLSTPVISPNDQYLGSRHVVVQIHRWKEYEKDLLDRSENLERMIQQRTAALKKKSNELEYSKNYYETLISGMLDIMLVMDNQGNCTFINDYGQKILGYAATELSEKRLPEFFRDFKRIQQDYGNALNFELRDHEVEVKTKNGEKILCNWNVHVLPELDGKPMGVMFVGRDITEYKKLQRQLQDQTRNLEILAERRNFELNRKVKQLNKIIQVGEDIILNLDLNTILKNICEAIQTLGWNIVVILPRDSEADNVKIITAVGLNEKRFNELVKNPFEFKMLLSLMQEQFRISNSYYIENTFGIFDFDKSRFPKLLPESPVENHSVIWKTGDALLVPIKIKTKVLGNIILQNPEARVKPDYEHVKSLEIFANKAAVVIENARLYQEAKKHAGQMEKASRLKSEFLANMSHELRTPLNSIITLASILLKGLPGELNPEQKKQILIVEKNSQNLLKLINNLLDLSKIEAGKMELHYTNFSIRELINSTVETIKPLCMEKGLKVEITIENNFPEVITSDSDKLNQILTNLLGNAVKFTQKGKISITLNQHEREKKFEIGIQDTGSGMSREDLEKIFTEFTQLENNRQFQAKGTGLGLSITKKLVELMEGEISVKSKPGKGTTFILIFPLKIDETARTSQSHLIHSARSGLTLPIPAETQTPVYISAKNTAETVRIEEKETRLLKRNETPSPKSSSKEKVTPRGNHILLVDDNEDNRYAMSYFLKDRGFKISFASNGEEGIRVAIKEKPNLIFMDVMMPGMDGYEATRILKGRTEFKNIPIIAMTAKAMSYDRERALEAGYDDYLAKPFTFELVVQKIEIWLK
ncbi:response regulator [candidate division KSB1 bacterium]|nr:response regulator [candidate division KSB1 bacterium]